MTWHRVALILVVVTLTAFAYLLVYALCKSASDADDRMEKF
jgi:hypothetical protein